MADGPRKTRIEIVYALFSGCFFMDVQPDQAQASEACCYHVWY
jgi:hypothetical protein